MPFYDIAGLVVEIKHPTGRTEKQARPYLCLSLIHISEPTRP